VRWWLITISADTSKKGFDEKPGEHQGKRKRQKEDEAIWTRCSAGWASRAYVAGRLSVRREAGEHLFHRCSMPTLLAR